jgi:rare lipoprotein A
VGLASWYGPGFYNHKTASGEKFKKEELTCAHRTLPFGTRLRVTNLQNDRFVEVRVNDRGPFVRNKLIDLSYAAAKGIGMFPGGSAKVSVATLVAQADSPPPSDSVSLIDLIKKAQAE